MNSTADIVICGAGIAGLACAETLSQFLPEAHLILVDKLPPMSLTSIKSGELYRDWWPDDHMARWIHLSIEMMEEHAHLSQNSFQMNRRGYAYVYTSQAGVQSALRSIEQFRNLGIGPVRFHSDHSGTGYFPVAASGFDDQPLGVDVLLVPELIRQHFPYVTEDAQAIVHARRCGWLSAQQFGQYLLERAKSRGVVDLRGEVVGISLDRQGVCAVTVSGKEGTQTIETRTVINAAGPFFAHLARMVGLELPVQTVLHRLLVMPDPAGVVPRSAPFTILTEEQELPWSESERELLASEPETRWLLGRFPGSLHVRPEGPLESNWIRLGWPYNNEPEEPCWEPSFSPEFPEIVLKGAVRLVPGLRPYLAHLPGSMTQDGGYYTKTAENLSLIGPSGVEGFYLLGALSGYGLMSACSAANLMCAWLTQAELPAYAHYFSLERYSDPSLTEALQSLAQSGEL